VALCEREAATTTACRFWPEAGVSPVRA
jgi:hypothetical protein